MGVCRSRFFCFILVTPPAVSRGQIGITPSEFIGCADEGGASIRGQGEGTGPIEPREASQPNLALGWEEIKDLQTGVVTKTYPDDTQPGGPVPRTVQYIAPYFRPDREQDYARAWAFFEQRNHD